MVNSNNSGIWILPIPKIPSLHIRRKCYEFEINRNSYRPHPIHGHRADISNGTFLYCIGSSSLSLCFGLVHIFIFVLAAAAAARDNVRDPEAEKTMMQPIHHAMRQHQYLECSLAKGASINTITTRLVRADTTMEQRINRSVINTAFNRAVALILHRHSPPFNSRENCTIPFASRRRRR